jgi:transposase
MIKKRSPYKTYTKEFKLEAVRLMREGSKPASAIAMELGIRRNQLYKWAEQLENSGELAFKGRGRPKKEDQAEVTTLKQENERLREEVEILKKAAAYFARDLK